MKKELEEVPKFWKYEGEILEYDPKSNYFTTKKGGKIPIIKVWEDGVPVNKQEK